MKYLSTGHHLGPMNSRGQRDVGQGQSLKKQLTINEDLTSVGGETGGQEMGLDQLRYD